MKKCCTQLLTVIFLVLFSSWAQKSEVVVLTKAVFNDLNKFEFAYNDKSENIAKEEYKRESLEAPWVISDREVYAWYPNGQFKSVTKFRKDANGKLIPSFKRVHTYGQDEELVKKAMYNYKADAWLLARKSEFEYNNGLLTKSIHSSKNKETGDFKITIQNTYKYNSGGKKVLHTSYGMDENLELKPEKKVQYKYEDGRLKEEKTVYKVTWGDKKGEWQPSKKLVYSYTKGGKRNGRIRYKYDEKWVPFRKLVYHFDQQGRRKETVNYFYSDGQWTPQFKTLIAYHSLEENARLVTPYLGEENEDLYGSEEGPVKASKQYKWDEEKQDWQSRGEIKLVWE